MPRGLMPDDKLRCPRCHSADIATTAMGNHLCEECRFDFSASYVLDHNGDRAPLDEKAHARHKAALAKAAGQRPLIIGIDPQHMRGVLGAAKSKVLQKCTHVPWYRPDLKCRYRAEAAIYTGVAEMFTGEPV
jgi:hypothetical protein